MTEPAATVIWIPRPPDNANSRGRWKGISAKRRYWAELNKRLAAGLIPKPPATPPGHAWISSVWWYDRSRRLPPIDPDNAVRRLKPVIDWLVAQGFLQGDSVHHVSLGGLHFTEGKVPSEAPVLTSVRLSIVETLHTAARDWWLPEAEDYAR